MNKYYLFLVGDGLENNMLAKEDNNNNGGITPKDILENDVIPWFQYFFSDINAVKILPSLNNNNTELIYLPLEEITHEDSEIPIADDNEIVESYILPSPCWVRAVTFNKGIMGCRNTLIFNKLEESDIELCEKIDNQRIIDILRPQEIRKQIDELRTKSLWSDVFENQEAEKN
jgi:hypothetical protein